MAVTVDEVKAHLRIQHDEEDGFILSLIAQAQAAAEDFCRVAHRIDEVIRRMTAEKAAQA